MLKKLANNTILHILLVATLTLFAFSPTLENFFYLDEWGNLYEWTHGYPYKYTLFTAHIFYSLFKTFSLNATGYFAAGLAVYTLSVIVFYLFVSRLLNNKVLGLVAGVLYATSPVGVSTTTMVWTYVAEGGYPLTVMLLVLLYLLLAYTQGRRSLHLFLLFFAFMFFLELMPRRSFLFLPILVLFDYLVNFKKSVMPNLGFVTRTAVLFALFIAYYKYDVSITKIFSTGRISFLESASVYDWQTKLMVAKEALADSRPLITLTNILLAGPWLFVSERLTGYVNLADVDHVRFVVIITLVVVISLVILAWKVKQKWGQLLLFSLGWIHINILGIYIFSSPGVNDTAHRTLSLTSPGYALFVTLAGASLYTFFASRLKKPSLTLRRVFIFVFLVVLAGNFLATRHTFEKFNKFHSRPARAFFSDLKRFYPTLPPNSLIYIQTTSNPQIKYQLSRIYGGNNYGSGSTIAVFYPEIKKEEILVVHNITEVEKFVGNDSTKINRVFGFYYDQTGLQDKTEEIRQKLTSEF